MLHCSRILLLLSFSGARRCHDRTFEQDYFLRTGLLLASKRRPNSVSILGTQSMLIRSEQRCCNLHWRSDRHGFAFSGSSCTARANVVVFRRARPGRLSVDHPKCRISLQARQGPARTESPCQWQCGSYNDRLDLGRQLG